VGSQIVILGNDDEKDVLELRTYHLKLREGIRLFFMMLFMHLGYDVSLCLFFKRLFFSLIFV